MNPHPVAMTPAEIGELRAWLGMTSDALATAIGADLSAVMRWQAGGRNIGRRLAARLADLVAYTNEFVDDLVDSHGPGSVITVYRKDDEFRAHVNTGPWELSANWHRRAVARAVERIPGGRFDYARPASDAT